MNIVHHSVILLQRKRPISPVSFRHTQYSSGAPTPRHIFCQCVGVCAYTYTLAWWWWGDEKEENKATTTWIRSNICAVRACCECVFHNSVFHIGFSIKMLAETNVYVLCTVRRLNTEHQFFAVLLTYAMAVCVCLWVYGVFVCFGFAFPTFFGDRWCWHCALRFYKFCTQCIQHFFLFFFLFLLHKYERIVHTYMYNFYDTPIHWCAPNTMCILCMCGCGNRVKLRLLSLCRLHTMNTFSASLLTLAVLVFFFFFFPCWLASMESVVRSH